MAYYKYRYKRKTVSIDSGKHAFKMYWGDDKLLFDNKIEEIPEKSPVYHTIVEFNGKLYSVGGSGERSWDASKDDELHQVSIYYGLTKIGLNADCELNLVIGTPALKFRNQIAKQSYRDRVYNNGKAELTVNGRKHTLLINDVLVLPESSGIIYQVENYKEYSQELIGVIDLGGLNAQGIVYDRTNIINETIFTENLGANILELKIKNALNEQNYNFQLYEIYHILRKLDRETEDIQRIVKDVMEKHLNQILEIMKGNNWNINHMVIVFTGGGSLLLKDLIQQKGFSVSEEGIWDNVCGWYNLAINYFGVDELYE